MRTIREKNNPPERQKDFALSQTSAELFVGWEVQKESQAKKIIPTAPADESKVRGRLRWPLCA